MKAQQDIQTKAYQFAYMRHRSAPDVYHWPNLYDYGLDAQEAANARNRAKTVIANLRQPAYGWGAAAERKRQEEAEGAVAG